MKYSFASALILLIYGSVLTTTSFAQDQNTWTHTYIKAKEGQKINMKAFLEANWFVMDSIAVAQGLFNDYELIENTSTDATSEWDYIVAVEYYTLGTYADIAEDWAMIREQHKKVLINGLDFGDLGSVTKSENVTRHTYPE